MRKRFEIQEGQLFRKPNAGVWEVVSLSRDGSGKLHARLRRVDDPNSTKTIAASVLGDPREFELVTG